MRAKAWLVDNVAANNLARELEIGFNESQIATICAHMADHRRGAVDLTCSRLVASVRDSVRELIAGRQHYRSHEWSDGCRSAEDIILRSMSAKMLEIAPRDAVTQGAFLRTKLGHARRKLASVALVSKQRDA